MTLIKYRPNRVNSFNGVDDFINRFFDETFKSEVKYDFIPAADIREDEKSYKIFMDIPGLNKEDLKVSFEKNVLTISGERNVEKKKEDEQYHLIERSSGSFSRNFRMPEDIDVTKIDAEVENGILKISIEKAEEKKPKLIDIKVK